MSKLLVANWKMNPGREREAVALSRGEDYRGVVICPPFPYLVSIMRHVRRAKLGAQDAFWEERGAYTGEVSPYMLRDLGVTYVLLGHSERRKWRGETDEIVGQKLQRALRAGLKVILCVGDSGAVRKKGIAFARRFVRRQLHTVVGPMSRWITRTRRERSLIITYEPHWAISTSRLKAPRNNAERPEDAREMIRMIKAFLSHTFSLRRTKVLYGGSVTGANASRILQYQEIDGALVGNASLSAAEFKKIVHIAFRVPDSYHY